MGERAASRFQDISARFWNLPSKGEEESKRELLFMDDIIQKAHVDREIARRIDEAGGIETVFDGGAGSGRFSIPLALKGLKVTHFDISIPMLEKARELAREAGVLDNIRFVEGRLTELGSYRDGEFDLVISIDAPVSYTYPAHREVISQLVRIAKKAVVISVASRFSWLVYRFNPIHKMNFLVDDGSPDPLVRWYKDAAARGLDDWSPDLDGARRFLASGLFEDPEDLYARYSEGKSPWPVTYCFTPDEFHNTLSESGLSQVRLSGPGAFARSIPAEILRRLLLDSEYRHDFLDLCYEIDCQPSLVGLGADTLVGSGTKVV